MEGKRTPVYASYAKYGGKNVVYGGWEMPVEYIGLVPEHEKVRNDVGLFDVSHMGEVTVKGKDAAKFVDYMTTNDVSKMVNNQCLYGMLCYPDGGVVDDLITYKFTDDDILLVINASNIDKDFAWLNEHVDGFDVVLENVSDETGQVAIQGPNAQKVLQTMTDTNLADVTFFMNKKDVKIGGINCLISRTGYTGEDGFEIYCDKNEVAKLFEMIADAGVQPIGLGARDTLRFESNLPLYGQEMTKEISPVMAGYGFWVKTDKQSDFIGKEALAKQKAEGVQKKIVGFEMAKGSPRHDYEVYKGDKKIGVVTTGYISPTLGKAIGLALVDIDQAEMGNTFDIAVRNKKMPATVVSRKFLKKEK